MALRSSLEGGGGWADAADGWGTGFEAQVPLTNTPLYRLNRSFRCSFLSKGPGRLPRQT